GILIVGREDQGVGIAWIDDRCTAAGRSGNRGDFCGLGGFYFDSNGGRTGKDPDLIFVVFHIGRELIVGVHGGAVVIGRFIALAVDGGDGSAGGGGASIAGIGRYAGDGDGGGIA